MKTWFRNKPRAPSFVIEYFYSTPNAGYSHVLEFLEVQQKFQVSIDILKHHSILIELPAKCPTAIRATCTPSLHTLVHLKKCQSLRTHPRSTETYRKRPTQSLDWTDVLLVVVDQRLRRSTSPTAEKGDKMIKRRAEWDSMVEKALFAGSFFPVHFRRSNEKKTKRNPCASENTGSAHNGAPH